MARHYSNPNVFLLWEATTQHTILRIRTVITCAPTAVHHTTLILNALGFGLLRGKQNMCECIRRSNQPFKHHKDCPMAPTPHVHAELIKAWADGAEIEYQYEHDKQLYWTSAGSSPNWLPEIKYRIKQQPKKKVTRWLWAYKYPRDVHWLLSSRYMTEQEFVYWTSAKGIKLEWSAMEFDE